VSEIAAKDILFRFYLSAKQISKNKQDITIAATATATRRSYIIYFSVDEYLLMDVRVKLSLCDE